MSFARVYRVGVCFGFVRSALLLVGVLCWVGCCFGSWVLLGFLCFLRLTQHVVLDRERPGSTMWSVVLSHSSTELAFNLTFGLALCHSQTSKMGCSIAIKFAVYHSKKVKHDTLSSLPFARGCRVGVWFGSVGAALLPAVGTCVVLAFGAVPGRLSPCNTLKSNRPTTNLPYLTKPPTTPCCFLCVKHSHSVVSLEFGLISLGLQVYFLQFSSAGLIVVLIPGCCWASSAFSV